MNIVVEVQEFKNYVNGEWARTSTGKTFDNINPADTRDIVGRFRAHQVGQIVLTLLPPIASPGLGIYDAQSERSEGAWWAKLKADIGQCMREFMHASLFLDLDEILALPNGRAGLDENPDHGGLLDSLPHIGDAELHV